MRNIILLGALVMFAFTASAQTDTPTCNSKENTEKVCAKTGNKCDETCANKKTNTYCEGKNDGDKASCSKDGDKKACSSKDGDKKACCSKDGDKASCSKDGDKASCSKDSDKKTCCSKDGGSEKDKKSKGEKTTPTKDVGLSK